jgi:mono/diheme cytochrome c family protein
MKTIGLALLILVTLPVAAHAQPLAGDRADYNRYCASCHGESGNGQGSAARWLSPAPPDLSAQAYQSKEKSGSSPDAQLRATIVRGVPGTSMPGWGALGPAQLDRIISTIKSFAPAQASR